MEAVNGVASLGFELTVMGLALDLTDFQGPLKLPPSFPKSQPCQLRV